MADQFLQWICNIKKQDRRGIFSNRCVIKEALRLDSKLCRNRQRLCETRIRDIRESRSRKKATNIDDKIKQENALSGALKSLFAVSESYPELKANENFNKLQDQLQRLEEEIAGSRRYYNGVVNRYNTKTELFPGNIIAGIFGFKRKPLFEVSNESERENVQVKF